MSDTPSDYFSLDNKGAVLGIAGISYQRSAGSAFHYALSHDNNPEYVIPSTTRELSLSFQNGAGATIPLADFGDAADASAAWAIAGETGATDADVGVDWLRRRIASRAEGSRRLY